MELSGLQILIALAALTVVMFAILSGLLEKRRRPISIGPAAPNRFIDRKAPGAVAAKRVAEAPAAANGAFNRVAEAPRALAAPMPQKPWKPGQATQPGQASQPSQASQNASSREAVLVRPPSTSRTAYEPVSAPQPARVTRAKSVIEMGPVTTAAPVAEPVTASEPKPVVVRVAPPVAKPAPQLVAQRVAPPVAQQAPKPAAPGRSPALRAANEPLSEPEARPAIVSRPARNAEVAAKPSVAPSEVAQEATPVVALQPEVVQAEAAPVKSEEPQRITVKAVEPEVVQPVAKVAEVVAEPVVQVLTQAEVRNLSVASKAKPAAQPVVEPVAQSAPESSTALVLPAVTVDALLWEKLLAAPTQAELRAASGQKAERLAMVYSMPPLEVVPRPNTHSTPLGMISESALRSTLTRIDSFRGLVISIGLNDPEEGIWRGEGLYQSVTDFVAGTLRKKDFGCRSALDEYLIICPDLQGADAHRHLNHVADLLWDFQLRGIGAWAILFSWGGVTATDEPLADAVASASERMRQAKRSRARGPVPANRLLSIAN